MPRNIREQRIPDGVAVLKFPISLMLASFSLLPGESWPVDYSFAS